MGGLHPKHLDTLGRDRRRAITTDLAEIRVALLAVVLALVGVVATVTPAGAQSPDPSGSVASPEAATPPPTVGPRFPASLGDGSPTMSAERDGVLLEVWLDHTSLPVGARLQALVRVSNKGSSNILWQTNICGTGPALTTIAPSRPPDTGVEWTGEAATFKRLLLENVLAPAVLWDAATIDLENVGCDTYSAIKPFKPGSVAEMTVAWDAVDRPGRPIVPGPATVTSTFETWKPRKQPAEPGNPDQELVASTSIEIVGEMGAAVPVARYADIALTSGSFRTWVESRKARPRSWDPYAIYWPNDDGQYPDDPRYERATEGAVDIGMFIGNGPHGEVTIDTTTLEVLGRKLNGKAEVMVEPHTPIGGRPEAVALRTQGPEPAGTPAACMAALISGTLVQDAQSGVGLRDDQGLVRQVVWPNGYSARNDGGRLALIDQNGEVVAHEGDRVSIGGGEIDDKRTWLACGGTQLVAP